MGFIKKVMTSIFGTRKMSFDIDEILAEQTTKYPTSQALNAGVGAFNATTPYADPESDQRLTPDALTVATIEDAMSMTEEQHFQKHCKAHADEMGHDPHRLSNR